MGEEFTKATSLVTMPHTIVMTGASRGIGHVAARHILRESPDAHLVVVARGSSGARLAAEL